MNATSLCFKKRIEYALMYVWFHVPVRRWDFDNMIAALKWPLDFLRIRGVIVNDSPARLWPAGIPVQRLVPANQAQVIIHLKAVSEKDLSRVVNGELTRIVE